MRLRSVAGSRPTCAKVMTRRATICVWRRSWPQPDRLRQRSRDAVGSIADHVIGQVGLFGGRFRQHVPWQLADGRERNIGHNRGTGEAMPQVVDADIGQSAAPPEWQPPVVKSDRPCPGTIGEHA